jgi:hypothetical protein
MSKIELTDSPFIEASGSPKLSGKLNKDVDAEEKWFLGVGDELGSDIVGETLSGESRSIIGVLGRDVVAEEEFKGLL